VTALNKIRARTERERLAEAAPDLLEACRLVDRIWAQNGPGIYAGKTEQIVKAAIAKAEGN